MNRILLITCCFLLLKNRHIARKQGRFLSAGLQMIRDRLIPLTCNNRGILMGFHACNALMSHYSLPSAHLGHHFFHFECPLFGTYAADRSWTIVTCRVEARAIIACYQIASAPPHTAYKVLNPVRAAHFRAIRHSDAFARVTRDAGIS